MNGREIDDLNLDEVIVNENSLFFTSEENEWSNITILSGEGMLFDG